MAKQYYFDGQEKAIGYARAVRIANHIHVSGTGPVDAGGRVVSSCGYEQAKHVARRILAAIEALGGRREDIIRVNIFLRTDADLETVGRAYMEDFGDLTPASMCSWNVAFGRPDFKVEMEAYAIIDD